MITGNYFSGGEVVGLSGENISFGVDVYAFILEVGGGKLFLQVG